MKEIIALLLMRNKQNKIQDKRFKGNNLTQLNSFPLICYIGYCRYLFKVLYCMFSFSLLNGDIHVHITDIANNVLKILN